MISPSPPVVGNPAILGPDEAAIPGDHWRLVRPALARAGLALIPSGADRAAVGYVVDFRRFNVADSAITVGTGQLFSGDLIHGIPTNVSTPVRSRFRQRL